MKDVARAITLSPRFAVRVRLQLEHPRRKTESIERLRRENR
ncbi:MAG: hypothetical protein ACOC7V_01700 [Spirochaetota bacterium]